MKHRTAGVILYSLCKIMIIACQVPFKITSCNKSEMSLLDDSNVKSRDVIFSLDHTYSVNCKQCFLIGLTYL